LQQELSHPDGYICCNDRLQSTQPDPLLLAESQVSGLAVLVALLGHALALSLSTGSHDPVLQSIEYNWSESKPLAANVCVFV
jgi:hypothetical protein